MSDDLPPLPEPYAIWETWGQNVDVFTAKQMREYAKRPWVGLTDDDFRAMGFTARPAAYTAIETKLKEKNT